MSDPKPLSPGIARPLLAALLIAALPTVAGAAVFNVTRADDPVPNGCLPGDCSVREALTAAAATPEVDQVLLLAGQYQANSYLLVQGGVELRGLGSDQTTLVSVGGPALLRMAPFANLTVTGVRMQAGGPRLIAVEAAGTLTFREVLVPSGGGEVGTDDPVAAAVDIRIEDSVLGPALYCQQDQGSCRVFDSELHGGLLVESDGLVAEIARSMVGPPVEPGFAGLWVVGNAALELRDSIVRNTAFPLYLFQATPQAAPDVRVLRTRFIGNLGPLDGNRDSWVRLSDVEFRDHVVPQDIDPSIGDRPAVLRAGPGPNWRFDRALVVGSRGGANTYGAAVTVEPGGVAGFYNSTFDNNTFHPAVSPVAGASHGIGVFGNSLLPATVFLNHTTLRRAASLAANAPGSVLSVRWATAQVLVVNSLLRGTCAFGAGGTADGTGTIESPGTSCLLDPQFNQSLPEVALRMGALADHGGFTHSYEPDPGSALIDAANPVICQTVPLDQRGFLRSTGGAGCDVGAVEAGALSDLIFAAGFQTGS